MENVINNSMNTIIVLKSNNFEEQKKLSLFKILDWREGVVVIGNEGFAHVPCCPTTLADRLTEKVGGYSTSDGGWETERAKGKESPLPSVITTIKEWLDEK